MRWLGWLALLGGCDDVCAGRSYCGCVETPGCAAETESCFCACDEGCSRDEDAACECICGGGAYLGCVSAGSE